MTPGTHPTAPTAAAGPFAGTGSGRGAASPDPRRAVIWEAVPAQEGLEALLRRRALEPERVESAPAAVLAVMRPGPPAAALILVDPASLPRAAEAVEVVRRYVPQTRVWTFQPPRAGSAGAGSLEPVEGRLRLATQLDAGGAGPRPTPSIQQPGVSKPAGGRLSSAELAMLLGPTRTLRSPAGDAG